FAQHRAWQPSFPRSFAQHRLSSLASHSVWRDRISVAALSAPFCSVFSVVAGLSAAVLAKQHQAGTEN
ncbi:MAG TPA: hypothetical protein PKL17_10370, partial [Pseudomonadota bacterium]|nr:hypothetical protein [Pseudomonadota bacterium]